MTSKTLTLNKKVEVPNEKPVKFFLITFSEKNLSTGRSTVESLLTNSDPIQWLLEYTKTQTRSDAHILYVSELTDKQYRELSKVLS